MPQPRGVFFVLAALLQMAAASAQEVTLPLERYEELRARSRPARTTVVPPPAPFALEAAQLEIAAGRDSARVAQRLTLSIYADDWVRIPITSAGSLTSTQLGTLDGRIETEGGIALVARGRGRHTLRLESVVPLAVDETATRATRNAWLPLPEAAVVTGTLVPGADVEEVEFVEGGLPSGTPLPRRHDFVGEPGATLKVQLRGAGRVTRRSAQALRIEASSLALARLSRTRTRVEARLEFEVANGEKDAFTTELPAGFDVVSVSPAELGWVHEASLLRLTPPAPVEGRLTVDLVLTGDPQASFAAPLLVPQGATHVRVMSAVQVEADGIPEMTDKGSSRRLEPGEATLPEPVTRLSVPVFLVHDAKRPPRWSVAWSEAEALLSAQIDRLLVNALVGRDGVAAYQLWAEVRSSGATEIVLGPPPGLELVAVERDGLPVLPGHGEKGLVIPLGAGSGVQVVHLSGLLSGLIVPEDGDLTLPMPSSTIPFAQVEVALRLPGERSYALANPERAGAIGSIPGAALVARPAPAKRGLDLGALAPAGAAARRRAAGFFGAPANSVLVQARWGALTGSLGPLAIRVKPSREREEWF